MGEVNRDLNGRRGRVLGMDTDGGMQVISAHVPQAELFNYATELRSLAQGRGSFKRDARPLRRRARRTSPRRSSRRTARSSRRPAATGATETVGGGGRGWRPAGRFPGSARPGLGVHRLGASGSARCASEEHSTDIRAWPASIRHRVCRNCELTRLEYPRSAPARSVPTRAGRSRRRGPAPPGFRPSPGPAPPGLGRTSGSDASRARAPPGRGADRLGASCSAHCASEEHSTDIRTWPASIRHRVCRNCELTRLEYPRSAPARSVPTRAGPRRIDILVEPSDRMPSGTGSRHARAPVTNELLRSLPAMTGVPRRALGRRSRRDSRSRRRP